jgi:TANFOR domain-containing protein
MLAAGSAAAQTPVRVTVSILPPYSPDLAVWRANPQRVVLIIQNNSQTETHTIRLSGRAENLDGSVVLTSKDDFPVTPITLAPGTMRTLNGNDLKLFDQNGVTVTGADRNVIARTGMLPEGEYRICVRALDFATLAPLSDGEPIGCTSFAIRIAEEPKLLRPGCDASIAKTSPQNLQFFWSTPVGVTSPVRYDFEMVQLQPTSRNPEEAFRSTPTFLFRKRNLTSTLLQYGPGDPQLVVGKRYAWRVRAFDPQRKISFRNGGYSIACAFTMKASGIIEMSDSVGQISSGGKGTKAPPSLIANQGNSQLQGDVDEADCPGGSIADVTDNIPVAMQLAVGDSIRIGLFSMRISKITGTGASGTKGEGMVKVPYLRAPVHVLFEDIKVNGAKQVVNGIAWAKQSVQSPLAPEQQSGLKSVALALAANKINPIVSRAQQNLVSSFVGLDTVEMPVGLDQTIAGQKYTVAIYGITFEKLSAKMDALMQIHLPGFLSPDSTLNLGASGLAIHPDGFGGFNGNGVAQLKLLTSVGYNSPTSVSFLVKGSADPNEATTVDFTCKGFKELHLVADAIFPREWFTPAPDDGTKAKATLRANIKKVSDWVASVDPIKWMIAPIPGFKLDITTMTYDHSDSVNPVGIVFPPTYDGETGTAWQGFHIAAGKFVLPDFMKTFADKNPELTLTNALVDGEGFTADISATSIVQYPSMSLAEWGASLDSIGLRIVGNSLAGGKMKGKIRVPISETGLDYVGLLSVPKQPGSKLQYQFSVKPKDSLNADLWLANLKIDSSSSIVIGNMNPQQTFQATALFNGMFSLPPSVSGLAKMALDLQGMKFDSLLVSSAAPYISPGSWKFASPQKYLSGLPIQVTNIGMKTSNEPGIRLGLGFTVSVNLFDSMLYGKSALTAWAKLESDAGGQKWKFDKMRIDTIALAADLGAVTFDGLVNFYYNDAKYGDGFMGALNVGIVKMVNVAATAQFGKKDGLKYWYVDAKATFPTAIPIPGVGIVGFYGFGGGLWHHMSAPDQFPQVKPGGSAVEPNKAVPGVSNTGVAYDVDPNVEIGFKATAVIGTTPSPKSFNGDITVWAEIMKKNGSLGLGKIGLDGTAYMMTDIDDRGDDATVRATMGVTYDAIDQILDGGLEYWFETPVIKSHGQMKMHFAGLDDWYLHVGTPTNRIDISTPLFGSKAYFMTGTYMPPAHLSDVIDPANIAEFQSLNLTDLYKPMAQIEGADTAGGGVAFGSAIIAGTGGPKKFLIFYADIAAVAGFDLALRHLPGVECGGSQIGLNNWYASGQAYAFLKGDVGIDVDLLVVSGRFSIFDILMGAYVEAALPNPTWMRGAAAGQYSILDGLIEGAFHFDFELGDKCRPTYESPLAGVPLITGVTPAGESPLTPVYVEPQASFAFKLDHSFSLEQMAADNEKKESRTFKIVLERARIELPNGDTVSTTLHHSADKLQIGLTPFEILPPNTRCTLRITVKGLEWKNDGWVPALTKKGVAITHDTTIFFKTGKLPTRLVAENVQYSYPRERQRFFMQKQPDYRTGYGNTPLYVKLVMGFPAMFAPGKGPDTVTTLIARFVPVKGGANVEVPYVHQSGVLKISQPNLAPGTVYQLQIIRKDSIVPKAGGATYTFITQNDTTKYGDVSNARIRVSQLRKGLLLGEMKNKGEKLLYSFYFRTSRFNTLGEKLAAIKATGTEVKKIQDFTFLTPEFSTEESFDIYDVTETGYGTPGSPNSGKVAPLLTFGAGKRTAPWYEKYANPYIYNVVAWMREKGLWNNGKLTMESQPGALFGGPVKAKLKESETKAGSGGTIPMGNIGAVTGYNSGSGYRTTPAPNPTFTVKFRDGEIGAADYQQMHGAILQALAENDEAIEFNEWYKRLPAKSPLKDQYELKELLPTSVVNKLLSYRDHDYTPITVGTYQVSFNPYLGTTTPPAKDFMYFPTSFKVKPPADDDDIDPANAAQVTVKAYTKP